MLEELHGSGLLLGGFDLPFDEFLGALCKFQQDDLQVGAFGAILARLHSQRFWRLWGLWM
jgi:hypothetical protein